MIKYFMVLVMAIGLAGCNPYEALNNFMHERELQKQLKLAESGDVEAQKTVASMYLRYDYDVDGVSVDNVKNAFEWYKKAAIQGDAEAQRELANLYTPSILKKITIADQITELGIKDSEKAFYWYEQAALNGDIEAQKEMADYYSSGTYVEQDLRKSFIWSLKAAGQGDPYSALIVGRGYYNGYGITKDIDRALSWMRFAAKNGEDDAAVDLIEILYNGYKRNGYDIPVDYSNVFAQIKYYFNFVYLSDPELDEKYSKGEFDWYPISTKNEAYLKYVLGMLYEKGQGTRQSYEDAKEAYGRACDLGEQRACDRYSVINTRN